MPIYEYQCEELDCRYVSERLRKLEDRDAPLMCSKCGGEAVRITSKTSPPNLKGQGFTPKFYPK